MSYLVACVGWSVFGFIFGFGIGSVWAGKHVH